MGQTTLPSTVREPPEQRPYVVSFNLNELIINMCALVQFHSHKLLDYADHKQSHDTKLAERARKYSEIAESLILRCQDAIDELEISTLSTTAPPS